MVLGIAPRVACMLDKPSTLNQTSCIYSGLHAVLACSPDTQLKLRRSHTRVGQHMLLDPKGSVRL